MKKIAISLLAAVALVFVPQTLVAVNYVQYLAYYSGSMSIGTDTLGGVTYSTVHYGNLYNGGEPGMPSLPIDYIRFSVPYNATNFTVTASPSRWTNSNLSHLLYPCQMPWIPNDTVPYPPITLPDTAAYFSGVSYPSEMAWVVDEGFLAGENHIVTVAVTPFRYSHTSTSDIVSKSRNLSIRLNYELSDSLAIYPIVRNDSALRVEGYELAQSMVVNPSQVTSFSYSFSNPGPVGPGGPVGPINPNGGLGGDGLNGGYQPIDPGGDVGYGGELQEAEHNYPYLIVTTSDLKHSVRRIAALKRQKGIDVMVMTLDQIYNHPISKNGYVEKDWNGNDTLWNTTNAGKIRQFLKFAYQFYNTKYVLLVGTDVPYTYFSPIPTDFYYCEFNSNYYQHKYEHYPEIYIGRILATSPTQINNYSDKLLRYELNPGNGDYSYLKRAFFNELGEFKDDLAGVISALSNIYPNPTLVQEDTDHDYPKGSDIINYLNSNKYGFWGTFTHGDTTKIKTYGNTERKYFIYRYSIIATGDTMNNGLDAIQNKYYPLVFYMPNCVTMPYNSHKKSFGETFITGKDFGGPVYMGSTYSISESSSKHLFEEFCEWIRKGEFKLGVADAKSKFYVDDEDSRIHNYLGDPSLELWTDIPQLYSGISISRTDSSMTISNLAVPSTVLTYYSTNKKLRTRIVSPQSITIEANPNYPVLLYKHNYIPYILPLFLQNVHISNNQYVIANVVRAGYAVDSERTPGYVTIKNGTQYEIEASGVVQLEGGFIVEPGAMFAVYPSSF